MNSDHNYHFVDTSVAYIEKYSATLRYTNPLMQYAENINVEKITK
jgi:hypothetical protein